MSNQNPEWSEQPDEVTITEEQLTNLTNLILHIKVAPENVILFEILDESEWSASEAAGTLEIERAKEFSSAKKQVDGESEAQILVKVAKRYGVEISVTTTGALIKWLNSKRNFTSFLAEYGNVLDYAAVLELRSNETNTLKEDYLEKLEQDLLTSYEKYRKNQVESQNSAEEESK